MQLYYSLKHPKYSNIYVYQSRLKDSSVHTTLYMLFICYSVSEYKTIVIEESSMGHYSWSLIWIASDIFHIEEPSAMHGVLSVEVQLLGFLCSPFVHCEYHWKPYINNKATNRPLTMIMTYAKCRCGVPIKDVGHITT